MQNGPSFRQMHSALNPIIVLLRVSDTHAPIPAEEQLPDRLLSLTLLFKPTGLPDSLAHQKNRFIFATLKTTGAILMLFLFASRSMTPAFDLACELQKLPNLFEHFVEHKICSDDSFIKFLAIHFMDVSADSHADQDRGSHDDLPFHGNHCEHITMFFALPFKDAPAAADYPLQPKIASATSLYPFNYCTPPFHPPQV